MFKPFERRPSNAPKTSKHLSAGSMEDLSALRKGINFRQIERPTSNEKQNLDIQDAKAIFAAAESEQYFVGRSDGF
jgi:hypothetical protein